MYNVACMINYIFPSVILTKETTYFYIFVQVLDYMPQLI